jgi:hypothetical protein
MIFHAINCSSNGSLRLIGHMLNYDRRPGAIDHSMGAEAMGMLGFAFASK